MILLVSHEELEVYRLAYRLVTKIFELTKSFTIEKRYSFTDQVRRSYSLVPTNITKPFYKRSKKKEIICKVSMC